MNLFDSKNRLEWRDYLRILRRRKWHFIVPFVLVLPLGILKIMNTEPIYESSCILQIESSRLLGSRFKSVVPGVTTPERGVSLKKRLLSTEYLTQLIHRLELQNGENIRLRAIEKHASYPEKSLDEIVEVLLLTNLRKNIDIRDYGSGVIEIKATSGSPELAYQIAQNLTDIFIEESLKGDLTSVKSALDFNTQQIAVYKQKLAQAERKLERYERGRIAKTAENDVPSAETFQRVREAILAAEISINEKQDFLESNRGKLANFRLLQTPNTPKIVRLRQQINQRQAQMAELLKRSSANSAEVINMNRTVNGLRDQIRDEITVVYERAYPEVEAGLRGLLVENTISRVDIEILTSKKAFLNDVIRSFRSTAQQNPADEMTLQKLKQEVELTRNIYNMFLQQSQGTEIEESLQRAAASDRFKVIEPPSRPLDPVNAGFKLILMVTVMFGTGLGGGAVYLSEMLDKSVRSVHEAETNFRIPVLGVMPLLAENLPETSGKRELVAYAVAGGIVVALALLIFLQQSGLLTIFEGTK